MTNEEKERRNNDRRVNELKAKIVDKKSAEKLDKDFLFVSYKSDDWETVLTEIVYKLVFEHGLNVYYDGSFDLHNKSWVEQMPENMDSGHCKGILAFLDRKYATSYATLMELMHSQTFDAGDREGLPIIPVNLEDLHKINDASIGDQDTGLGVKVFEDGKENVNYSEELKLFKQDYDEIIEKDYIKKDFKLYRDDKIFKKKKCSEMVNQLLASRGYNTNMYAPDPNFYSNLIQTIIDDCGKGVFSTPSGKVSKSAAQTAPAPAPAPASVSAPEPSNENKKRASTTGDITYSIYGKEYTDNQSNMMLNVFAKVLMKHPDAVAKILEDSEKPMIRCASAINYELPENKTDGMPSRYLAGQYLDVGGGIFIGTALNYPEKLRNIAQLLTICGEDFSVLRSEQIELPENVKSRASGGGVENYTIYGEEHSGNQTQMMIDTLKFIMEKHFDKREELAGLLSIKLAPMSELTPYTYFRSGEEFVYQGITYSIGTSFGRIDKLKQIKKAIAICGEDITQFVIEGLNDPGSNNSAPHSARKKRNFLLD